MALHQCTECGLTHDHGGALPTDPAVEIARIQAERDMRIAELQRGELDKTELEAETEIAVAEIEAAAGVEEATVKAEVLDDILTPPEPEPEPVVVVEPEPEPEPEPLEAAPPPAAEPASITEQNKRAGYWDYYR